VLRTDEIRKRLAGVEPFERLPPQAYAPDAYAAVYEALFDSAERALQAGWAVILDASFVDPALRERAQGLARAAAVPFQGVWLQAPAAVLAERIRSRTADASDATLGTLDMQLERNLGRIDWLVTDAGQGVEAAAQAWASARGPQRAK
jgi:uncharacterized protein